MVTIWDLPSSRFHQSGTEFQGKVLCLLLVSTPCKWRLTSLHASHGWGSIGQGWSLAPGLTLSWVIFESHSYNAPECTWASCSSWQWYRFQHESIPPENRSRLGVKAGLEALSISTSLAVRGLWGSDGESFMGTKADAKLGCNWLSQQQVPTLSWVGGMPKPISRLVKMQVKTRVCPPGT